MSKRARVAGESKVDPYLSTLQRETRIAEGPAPSVELAQKFGANVDLSQASARVRLIYLIYCFFN